MIYRTGAFIVPNSVTATSWGMTANDAEERDHSPSGDNPLWARTTFPRTPFELSGLARRTLRVMTWVRCMFPARARDQGDLTAHGSNCGTGRLIYLEHIKVT